MTPSGHAIAIGERTATMPLHHFSWSDEEGGASAQLARIGARAPSDAEKIRQDLEDVIERLIADVDAQINELKSSPHTEEAGRGIEDFEAIKKDLEARKSFVAQAPAAMLAGMHGLAAALKTKVDVDKSGAIQTAINGMTSYMVDYYAEKMEKGWSPEFKEKAREFERSVADRGFTRTIQESLDKRDMGAAYAYLMKKDPAFKRVLVENEIRREGRSAEADKDLKGLEADRKQFGLDEQLKEQQDAVRRAELALETARKGDPSKVQEQELALERARRELIERQRELLKQQLDKGVDERGRPLDETGRRERTEALKRAEEAETRSDARRTEMLKDWEKESAAFIKAAEQEIDRDPKATQEEKDAAKKRLKEEWQTRDKAVRSGDIEHIKRDTLRVTSDTRDDNVRSYVTNLLTPAASPTGIRTETSTPVVVAAKEAEDDFAPLGGSPTSPTAPIPATVREAAKDAAPRNTTVAGGEDVKDAADPKKPDPSPKVATAEAPKKANSIA